MDANLQALRRLAGDWIGTGKGHFPTIDSFRYAEETNFYWNGIEPMLRFEQRTWRLGPDDERIEPLHWEVGFFHALADGAVEIVNAQNGERVEVMRGSLRTTDGGWTLDLESRLLGHDPRVIATRRQYVLADGALSYRIWMATTKVAELTPHLEMSLSAAPTPEASPTSPST